MPRTESEQKAWEQQCYGCTVADLEVMYEREVGKGRDATFYAVCILSDVQHLMAEVAELDDACEVRNEKTKVLLEIARQYVNKAKWFCRYDARKREEAV